MLMKKTRIIINLETKKKLVLLGKMNETFDSLLNELIEHAKHCDRFWGDRY